MASLRDNVKSLRSNATTKNIEIVQKQAVVAKTTAMNDALRLYRSSPSLATAKLSEASDAQTTLDYITEVITLLNKDPFADSPAPVPPEEKPTTPFDSTNPADGSLTPPPEGAKAPVEQPA